MAGTLRRRGTRHELARTGTSGGRDLPGSQELGLELEAEAQDSLAHVRGIDAKVAAAQPHRLYHHAPAPAFEQRAVPVRVCGFAFCVQPSPTLSPTDPVARGLLTLWRGAQRQSDR